MPSRGWSFSFLVFSVTLLAGEVARAQLPGAFPAGAPSPEAAIVESATSVLNEVMAIPAKAIPRSMLSDAQGIAIIPGMVKGGFVIGVRHGRGVVVTRANGGWTAPVFVSITGGSVGWQAGLQSTDVILVFKTKKSIQGLTNGKFTIGADASAAAGPVGREASIGTDIRLKSEIYSYSRSRGLFAGVALDGSAIQIDGAADNRYYWSGGPPTNPAQAKPLPPSALQLLETVAKYTAPETQQPLPATAQPISTVDDPNAAQTAAAQLTASFQQLDKLLDANWRAYLALPADPNPDAASLATVVSRYETVATNPQYQKLASRAEFQQTYGLLKSWASLRTASVPLALPPPPQ